MYQSSHMARNLISGRGVKHFIIAPMQGWHKHTQIKKCPRLQFFDAQHVYLDPFTSGSNSTNQKLRLRYSIDSQFQMLQWRVKKSEKMLRMVNNRQVFKGSGMFLCALKREYSWDCFFAMKSEKGYNREVTKHHSVDDCMIHGSVWCAYLVAETDVETRGNASATEMSSTKPTAVDWCRVLLELFLAKLVSQMEWVYIAIDMHSAASCGKQSCIRVY